MRTPSIHVLSDDEFLDRIGDIEASLDQTCREGTLTAFDGISLFYRFYPASNSRGTIVLVHGLSEFYEKFHELSWYCLQQGYSVLVYDQRGHGHSSRLTPSNALLHVDSFDDYARDLDQVITEAALPLSGDAPLFLLGHSMGGAVICLYLKAHPDTPVKKAVLSAPLIRPSLNMPLWVARMGTVCERVKNKRMDVASFISKPFNPNAAFDNSPDLSRARFEYNLKLRCSHERYQTVMKTIGWNREALYINRRLLRRSFTNAVHTPLLLLSAQRDTVVDTRSHHRFAARCDACRLYVVAGAKHSMFTGTRDVYADFLTQIFVFFRDTV